MKNSDWLKILEKDDTTDWEWYARWLLDEQCDKSKYEAIQWILENYKQPYQFRSFYSNLNKYCWYREVIGGPNPKEQCIPWIIHDFIKFGQGYSYSKIFNSKLEAKLALIEAYDSTRLD